MSYLMLIGERWCKSFFFFNFWKYFKLILPFFHPQYKVHSGQGKLEKRQGNQKTFSTQSLEKKNQNRWLLAFKKTNQKTQEVKNECFLISTRQNQRMLFYLVDIKKRSFLTSCVFWSVTRNSGKVREFDNFEVKKSKFSTHSIILWSRKKSTEIMIIGWWSRSIDCNSV